MHRVLVSLWARLYDVIDGARFEPGSDLIVAVCPEFPIPQCNGPWVVEDSPAAVDALPAAIATVSTALGFTIDGATGIFNVATPPEHRGRGYGAVLTARAARDGFEAGSEFAFLQSSEIGHTVYRRLGFRDVEEYVLLTRPPMNEG